MNGSESSRGVSVGSTMTWKSRVAVKTTLCLPVPEKRVVHPNAVDDATYRRSLIVGEEVLVASLNPSAPVSHGWKQKTTTQNSTRRECSNVFAQCMRTLRAARRPVASHGSTRLTFAYPFHLSVSFHAQVNYNFG